MRVAGHLSVRVGPDGESLFSPGFGEPGLVLVALAYAGARYCQFMRANLVFYALGGAMTTWFLLLMAVLGLSGCGYNDFQRLDEQTKSAWSEVLS
jgi:hypothetical protein